MASYYELGANLQSLVNEQKAQQMTATQHLTATNLHNDPTDNLRDFQLRIIGSELPELWDAYHREHDKRRYDQAADHLVHMILGIGRASKADEQLGLGDVEFISSREKAIAGLVRTINTGLDPSLQSCITSLYAYPMETKRYFPNPTSPVVVGVGQRVLVETLVYIHGVQHREPKPGLVTGVALPQGGPTGVFSIAH